MHGNINIFRIFIEVVGIGNMKIKKIVKILLLIGFLGQTVFAQEVLDPQDKPQALSYMSFLSVRLVGRSLNTTEINLLKAEGSKAFTSIVGNWVNEAGFAASMQIYTDTLMGTSGVSTAGDFNLPGYLAKDIVLKKKPYSELLTAQSCVNSTGQPIACDTQAPFTAGVLTTKAFLVTYKGAYNISRAGKLLKKFTCSSYPLSEADEPRLTQEELITQFATQAGKITFGNGNNCYSCHSQFGLHTQFFVKFDTNGVYKSIANGLQNTSTAVTDGFSTNSTYTSHLKSPARAQDESSRIFGRTARNLAEAAKIIVEHPRFKTCAVQNLMKYSLRLSDQDLASVNVALFEEIAKSAMLINTDPHFSDLVKSIVTNKHVFNSYKKLGLNL